ncbi:hypothetical protein CK203_067427 [Vitis vinifera]|uniref:RRM domain-containing protein n=1 Tax=Vitis vinifera TaxID=29760 RepID=A0A438EBR9_VITVI|nr:hypothetical protein CK203_067427 [Vitis vinifera]
MTKEEAWCTNAFKGIPFNVIQFSWHSAAARAHRMGSKSDFLLGDSWHPVVEWAEEPEIDPEELAKITIAFVGNLPKDANEDYLKKLFGPFGKVEKVLLSKKGQSPVGFVHFAKRSGAFVMHHTDGCPLPSANQHICSQLCLACSQPPSCIGTSIQLLTFCSCTCVHPLAAMSCALVVLPACAQSMPPKYFLLAGGPVHAACLLLPT